ncbi:HNH endonuclease [Vallitalea maricola]|uniref:Uncharacterized protein n=1 Tax=Vallitalea maricola TaxID=3074433 RepID=A0ACB5UPY0_9FIRM|nr:hypothetical protein AN2V17_38360 [Vallitalea sp. AN17-2]
MNIFNYDLITLSSNADRLFKSFLEIVEDEMIDFESIFRIEDIYILLKKREFKKYKPSSFKYSFMSMFGGQSGRDYFIFKDMTSREWFTEVCNDTGRKNLAWRDEKANEAVRINPKYVSQGIIDMNDRPYGSLTDEEELHYKLIEGARKQIIVNAYERNKVARDKCIEYYGLSCSACGIVLENVYGEIARDFIHVHHIKPLHEIDSVYTVDPINDLRPVCPNCHAVIHRYKNAIGVSELKDIIVRNATGKNVT